MKTSTFIFIVIFFGTVTWCLGQQDVTEAGKSGLSVVTEPARAAIKPGEAIALRVTFRNTSTERFLLSDQIIPPPYNFWYLKLKDVTTGKAYTGVSTRPMGAAPMPGEVTPAALRDGEAKTVNVSFTAFAFVEGDMDFQAARNIWFPHRLEDQTPYALPGGTFDVRVMVRFQSLPTGASDPIPLWKGGAEILSSSTSITISRDAESSRVELLQIARDKAISVLDFLLTARTDSDFVSTTIHSGLWNDLRAIETAANDVKLDDGTATDMSSTGIRKLNDVFDQSAKRALEISSRSNETTTDRTKARQLASKLRELAAPSQSIP